MSSCSPPQIVFLQRVHPLTVDGDKPLISAWTNNKIKLAMKEDKILALKEEMKPAVNKIEDKIEADLEQRVLPSGQQRYLKFTSFI